MKLLVDMNLSPKWCSVLQTEGWDCLHWSDVGVAGASDHEVMHWAMQHDRVVLTHDLDFSAILAATQAMGPSVVQVRTQDIRPSSLAPRLTIWLRQYTSELEAGAIVVIDEARSRVRLLPLQRD
jgi:predicted nuclease of predicted toxin-antitoxin system